MATINQTTTVTPQAQDIFQSYRSNVIIAGARTLQSSTNDLRNITLQTTGDYNTICYMLAAKFNATEGETLSGHLSSPDVPVNPFVVDNASFYFFILYPPIPPECPNLSDPAFLVHKTGANAQNYTIVIPRTGIWWIGGEADGKVVFGHGLSAVKWSWDAFLTSPAYVTTVSTITTVTQPVTLPITQNLTVLQTQATQLSISAEQLYGGLAAVFAALFMLTLVVLVRQRRSKRRR